MLAIIKKELRQYFYSMIGFVFLAFFLAIIGLYTWAGNLTSSVGNFEMTLGGLTFIYIILIPILTMRIIAEEKKQRTDQLLYTAPISLGKIVVGKYISVIILFTLGMLVVCLYPLLISTHGEDVRLSLAYSSIIGFYLLGAANIAVGLFISSLTESQVIAAVVSFIVLLLSNMITNIVGMIPSDSKSQCAIFAVIWIVLCLIFYNFTKNITATVILGVLGEAAIWTLFFVKKGLYEGMLAKVAKVFAISEKFDDFSLGIIKYDAILYYLSVIFIFIFLTIQVIRKKRFG